MLNQKIDSLRLTIVADKLFAISYLQFFRTLKHLETYLEKIDWLRNYVSYYAQKTNALQQRKTRLLKRSLSKDRARKAYSQKTSIETFIDAELDSFNQLQEFFSRSSYLIHFDKTRELFIDVDASKKREFDVMIYHVKSKNQLKHNSDLNTSASESSKRLDVKSFMFLSKMLSPAEERYWSTELKMTELIWVVRKLRLMIISFDHFTVIYTDHVANSVITRQKKLFFSSVDKLNLRLVRVSMYLSQFRLDVRYKFEQSHIISDALSRLSSRQEIDVLTNSLNINSFHNVLKFPEIYLAHAYQDVSIKMSKNFRSRIKANYIKDKSWTDILKMLTNLKERVNVKDITKKSEVSTEIDFELRNELIYYVHDESFRLCVSNIEEKNIFQLAHNDNAYVEHHHFYQRVVDFF